MKKITFSDFSISPEILNSLEKLGYQKPSMVQNKTIPLILENKDIIVKAETGSGKTAAYGIPICENIDIMSQKPQALILSPTRELAVQIKEDISNIGRFKKIRCAAVYGKEKMHLQVEELKQRIHVIVGTPGRTLDHIQRNTIDLSKIKYLVIDEADKMLNMGFIEQIHSIIKTLPNNRVTMLFSATMPFKISELCKKYMKKPVKIEIAPEKSSKPKIEQFYYEVIMNQKLNILKKILYVENPESCIVFCNTKDKVKEVTKFMKNENYSCECLHGDMMQNDRLNVMQNFKKGRFTFMVATDLAARGIDIDDITHVINFDVPEEKESYVHRIGRTARAGKTGKAITFVYPYEYKYLKAVMEYEGYEIPKKEIPSEETILKSKKAFENNIKKGPKIKKDKLSELNKDITKIHINAGKKKKIRAGDIVGALSNINEINAEDIGIIEIFDNFSYIDILNGKGELVLQHLNNMTIKRRNIKAEGALK